jgi:hypothetical protein
LQALSSDSYSDPDIPVVSAPKPASNLSPARKPLPPARLKPAPPQHQLNFYSDNEDTAPPLSLSPPPGPPVAIIAPIQTVSDTPVDRTVNSFNIFRELKKFAKFRSEQLRMVQDEAPVFFSAPGKDHIGRFYIISTLQEVKMDPIGFAGLVRTHNLGERFTIISNELKPNDDRDGELAGISFHTASAGSSSLIGLKLVLTANGRPHFPISKRWNMSRVAHAASRGEEINEKFVAFESKIAVAKDDWEALLGLGGIPVMKSRKNCVICDGAGERIFVLYKISDSWFGMKCRFPITPLVGFGLALAIISSAK